MEQSDGSIYPRLLSIEKADQIIFIEEGQIAESARYAELLALQGIYARPHRMQFSGPSAPAV